TAATDDRISGILLQGQMIPIGYGSGYAALREVRDALGYFQEQGKPVFAYMENPGIRDYYLGSIANQVLVNPYSVISFQGLASQQIFFAGALEKFGIDVQVVRVGEFKSAVEPFTRTDMSDENRLQSEELLFDLWGNILATVGESRQIAPQELHELSQRLGMLSAAEAVEEGLVDRVAYPDELRVILSEAWNVEAFDDIPSVEIGKYIDTLDGRRSGRGENLVAVVYLEGNIIGGVGRGVDIGADRFTKEIRRLREDDRVKAIVLRVNSPGGSAVAAEAIQREIVLARQEKPVVVSFGAVAASGGYWVAAESDYIFAQPNTLTGSIGVFGLLPNVQELGNELGITWDTVKTGPFADIHALSRPKTDEEIARVEAFVAFIYDEFLTKVAQGRQMDMDRVEAVAGGRVWTGSQALQHGLIDQLGGLTAAIDKAVELGGITEDWQIYEYPRTKDLAEVIAELLSQSGVAIDLDALPRKQAARIAAHLGNWDEMQWIHALGDPRHSYARLPFDFRFH
ncbi:MAG: signal peptide peptidase SppA, partial [Opitutales bacterium]